MGTANRLTEHLQITSWQDHVAFLLSSPALALYATRPLFCNTKDELDRPDQIVHSAATAAGVTRGDTEIVANCSGNCPV